MSDFISLISKRVVMFITPANLPAYIYCFRNHPMTRGTSAAVLAQRSFRRNENIS